MAEWRVLIADDEPAARRGVRQLLAPYPDFAVVGECRDGADVLVQLDRLQPDVLFLDVQMPELSGLEVVAQRRPETLPAIVFLTAYDRYALAAFDAAAHDYLVKPVGEARFAEAMRRLTERLARRAPATPPAPLHAASAVAAVPERLLVSSAHETIPVAPAEIAWVEAAGNYAQVWVAGKPYLLREPLARLATRLAPAGFVRVHRGALVRLGAVRAWRVTGDGGLMLTLDGARRVGVSRRRRADILSLLKALGQ